MPSLFPPTQLPHECIRCGNSVRAESTRFCSDCDDHDVASCSRIIGDVLLFFRREIALFNSFAPDANQNAQMAQVPALADRRQHAHGLDDLGIAQVVVGVLGGGEGGLIGFGQRLRLRSNAAVKMRRLRSMSRQLPTRISTRVRTISSVGISKNSPISRTANIASVVTLRLTGLDHGPAAYKRLASTS